MRKKFLGVLVVAALGVSISLPASAQFGGLSLGGKSNDKAADAGDIEGKVKDFNGKSLEISRLTYVSMKAIEAAYASTEEAAKIAEQVKAFNSSTDAKEQQAKAAEVLKSDAAKIEEMTKSKDAAERTKNLSKDKQKQLLSGVVMFAIAGKRAADVAKVGSSIIQGAGSNPMNLSKILPVKDGVSFLGSAGSATAKILPGLLDVLKGANLQVPAVTAESKVVDDPFK